MKIINLGTSHGDPTKTHYQSSTMIETGGKTYLVDAGEPAAGGIIRHGVRPVDLTAVFITHMHIDHAGGLPVLVEQSLKYFGRERKAMPQFLIPDEQAIDPLKNWLVANQVFSAAGCTAIRAYGPGCGYDDGTVKAEAFPNGHMAWSSRAGCAKSYSLRLTAEGKKVFFTGDVTNTYLDMPAEAADGCDLMFSELTHFPLEKALPVLKKLHLGKLVFYHLLDPWQTEAGKAEALELCRELPYPVAVAFDGMVHNL